MLQRSGLPKPSYLDFNTSNCHVNLELVPRALCLGAGFRTSSGTNIQEKRPFLGISFTAFCKTTSSRVMGWKGFHSCTTVPFKGSFEGFVFAWSRLDESFARVECQAATSAMSTGLGTYEALLATLTGFRLHGVLRQPAAIDSSVFASPRYLNVRR